MGMHLATLSTPSAVQAGTPPGLMPSPVDRLPVRPTRRRYPLTEFLRASPLLRSDIAFNSPGLPLTLTLRLRDGWGLAIPRAAVYIWHHDACGWTFDAADDELGAVTMMRGVQFTDAHGAVQFRTVYPGRYGDGSVPVYVQVYFSDGRHVVSRTDACLQLPARSEALGGRLLAPPVGPGQRKPRFDADREVTPIEVAPVHDDPFTEGLRADVVLNVALVQLPASH